MLNLIEKIIRNSLEHTGTGDNLLSRILIVQALIPTALDLMILKGFSKTRDTVNQIKWHPSKWKKNIFVNSTYDRGLKSIFYKELKKLDINKNQRPKLKMGSISKQIINNREISIDWETMKFSTSAIREMQIKIILTIHLTRVRMGKSNKTSNSSCEEDVEEGEHSYTDSGSADFYSYYANQYGSSSESRESIYLSTKIYHSWAYTQKTLHPTSSFQGDPCGSSRIFLSTHPLWVYRLWPGKSSSGGTVLHSIKVLAYSLGVSLKSP